jgi:hypothetical protein
MPVRKPKTRKRIELATRRFVAYLRYRAIGPHALTQAQLKDLVRAGLIRPGRPPKNAVQRAYELTHAKVAAQKAPVATRDAAVSFLERMFDRYAEKAAKGLEADILGKLEAELMPFTDRSEGKLIYSLLKDPEKKKGYLGRALKGQVKNWSQRWKLIVDTELARASNLGAADAIIQNNKPDKKGPAEITVFKQGPNDGATCKHCRRFWFLEDGITPRVYKMTDLMAGGTNIGRKQAEWRPTIDLTHPRCRHALQELRPGYGFVGGGLQFISKEHDEYESQRRRR